VRGERAAGKEKTNAKTFALTGLLSYTGPYYPSHAGLYQEGNIMADTSKKTVRTKKAPVAKTSKVPTAKAVAAAAAEAETKGQPAPAAVKAAVTPPAKPVVPAPAKPVAPATPVVAKPAAPVAPAKPVAPKPTMVSKAERQRMIEQAAYFRAEKHGFQGDSSEHWSAAESEIDADLKRRGVTVV
jgi:hypothetical protein